MKRIGRRWGGWRVTSILAGTVLLVGAGSLGVVRPDPVEVVRCIPELSGGHDQDIAVALIHRDAILAEAQRADLPPELLAAIVADHQRELTPWRRFSYQRLQRIYAAEELDQILREAEFSVLSHYNDAVPLTFRRPHTS